MIRPARIDDRGAILALTLAMGGHDDIAAHAEPLRRFGAVLEDPRARVLVAEHDGRVVGYLELQLRASIVTDRFEAWIGALAVDPNLRGGGIGAALLDAADECARLAGADAIVLECSDWRVDAHRFYRTHGFIEKPLARRFVRVPPDAGVTLEERFLAAAARAANAVSAAVAGLQARDPIGLGADGAATEAADAAAEAAALDALAPLGLSVLSEERGLVGPAPGADDWWIALDPLDGSRNFRAGHPPYATSIGLVHGSRPVCGYVLDLTTGRRWWAKNGQAFADGVPANARRSRIGAAPSPLRGATPGAIPEVGRVRVSGSTVVDLCRVADGASSAFVALERPVVHVHDLAAAYAIVLAAGGAVLARDGAAPALIPDATATIPLVAAADRSLAYQILDRQ